MTILITEGLGFLGSNPCYEFLKENRRILIGYDEFYRISRTLIGFESGEKFVFVKATSSTYRV